MTDPFVSSSTDAHGWRRVILMLVFFFVVYYPLKVVVAIGMLLQIVMVWVAGGPNERLRQFSANLNLYLYQILEYVSFNSDRKPFPFSDWPDADEDGVR